MYGRFSKTHFVLLQSLSVAEICRDGANDPEMTGNDKRPA
jgi:hypothetical protein